MNLTTVINAIKTRCPSFAGRVAGAAEFKALPEAANMTVPASYVIPLDDSTEAQRSQNGYAQVLRDSFAVIVALPNVQDERGQGSIASVHSLRAELWAGLLGWEPEAAYGQLEYEGGQLLQMDRARLYYQFEFASRAEITTADTYQGTQLGQAPALQEVNIKADIIDPAADPNVQYPGPDGRIEHEANVSVPQ